MQTYKRSAGSVYSLKYHLVWCPKYRRSVLKPPIDTRLKQLIYQIAEQHDMQVHALEVMPDHVHLFVESDPIWPVAKIVNRFKGTTSRILRKEYPLLKRRMPTLWSPSYYAGTVGHVSHETVQRYIENQKT